MVKEVLRNNPWLFSLVYRIRFLFSPSRIFGKVFVQATHRAHRRMTTIIASPGHLDFAGGIYNPGALPIANNEVVLLAKGQFCHWWDAVGTNANLYYQGNPVIFILAEDLQVKFRQVVKLLKNFPEVGRVGYEDFRLFQFGDETWVNHSMIPLVQKHACWWTFREARPCLSRFDLASECLTFLGHPQMDFPVNRIEKNWTYLERDGELFLFYSFSPYRILRLVDRQALRFATIINHQLDDRCANVGGFGTMVSLSTNPIEYDKHHWLLLVHQIERSRIERIYHHWGVLLDKNTLLPYKITADPIFSGMGARGRKPGVVYVSSVVKMGEDFVFFMGEGDAYVTRATFPKSVLENLWADIPLSAIKVNL